MIDLNECNGKLLGLTMALCSVVLSALGLYQAAQCVVWLAQQWPW